MADPETKAITTTVIYVMGIIIAAAIGALAVVVPFFTQRAEQQATQAAVQATPTLLPIGLVAGNPVRNNTQWTPVTRKFDTVDMVLVPVGCFNMGNDPAAYDNGTQDVLDSGQICFEAPFWIDQSEVTNAQFTAFHGREGRPSHWTEANSPREQISWLNARNFCASRDARLPTEAEWEYAARGPSSLVYPWGNEFEADKVVYLANSGGQTQRVGSQEGGDSWVGAWDMSGNVWEWVGTAYHEYPYPAPGSNEEMDEWLAVEDEIRDRVRRGGSWHDGDTGNQRSATRESVAPSYGDDLIGFRCIHDFHPDDLSG